MLWKIINHPHPTRVGNRMDMKKIIVTDEEIHSTIIKRELPVNGKLEVVRYLTPIETRIHIANEKANVTGNLLNQDWDRKYIPEKRHWVFYKLNTQTYDK